MKPTMSRAAEVVRIPMMGLTAPVDDKPLAERKSSMSPTNQPWPEIEATEDGESPWSMPAAQVLDIHGVTVAHGLDDREAHARLQTLGPNQLRQQRPMSALSIVIHQLKSAIVLLLLAAALVSFLIGDIVAGVAIGAAIGLTVALGFFTELRAVRSMEALRRLGAQRARVRRSGDDTLVDAAHLVPGDIVVLEDGDRITADLRLVEASKLEADESALTGESVPVSKSAASIAVRAALADRHNMLYKGTTLTRGSGVGVVVATGMQTELGRIATLVEEAEDELTPLERRLEVLGRRLLWISLAAAAMTSVVGMIGGRSVALMIETGIALAVAAIPEGLPIVATVALARGMWRLAARHALIKRLAAVETLGATSVIVADKTGTLTANQMHVVSFEAADRSYTVSDTIQYNGAPIQLEDDSAAMSVIEVAVLCNNASLAGDRPIGDPLEVALLRLGAMAGMSRSNLVSRWPELREEAFDPDIKLMATVHADGDGVRVAVKGAPEVVLEASASCRGPGGISPLSDMQRHAALVRSEEMARSGLRVLALAAKSAASADVDVYAELVFIGLVGLADPPRRDVVAPIATCRRSGIQVVMATGDQPATATNIACAVGLMDATSRPAAIVHGDELASMASMSEERQRALRSVDVFARVTPEQKLDIIALHQAGGAVVAMTGDGVNDAPALRKADIGIAMGERGTDVARDAADMVLKDDSFDSIVAAIEQGRAIFTNIRRFIVYLLSCNLSEICIVAAAVLVGMPLPLLPLQILFLNLVNGVFPALALGFGEGDSQAMSRPPRTAGEPIVAGRHWAAIAAYAGLITVAVLGAMGLALATGVREEEATTVAFLTLGFAQLWHVFNIRERGSKLVANDIVRNPWIWGAMGLGIASLATAAFAPPLAQVLEVTPLAASSWSIVVGVSLLPLVIGQLILGHGADIAVHPDYRGHGTGDLDD